jgi:hypothetical protein
MHIWIIKEKRKNKGGTVVPSSQSSCEDGPEAAACPFLPFLSLSRRTVSHSRWSQPHNQHQVDATIIPRLELWRGSYLWSHGHWVCSCLCWGPGGQGSIWTQDAWLGLYDFATYIAAHTGPGLGPWEGHLVWGFFHFGCKVNFYIHSFDLLNPTFLRLLKMNILFNKWQDPVEDERPWSGVGFIHSLAAQSPSWRWVRLWRALSAGAWGRGSTVCASEGLWH